MPGAEDLRQEARRCLDAIKEITDPVIQQKLALRSYELIQQSLPVRLRRTAPLEATA